ncbi:MAG: hypothetical protein IKE43_02750 [Coriobacteriales bacterium]|nr:hypothetical protein [Coriobacteriales bacterium]
MPRYDYRCTECNHVFEVTHGMKEHPDILCPECGAAATRVFDVSGIILKGSGFYNTDQRGKKGATPATAAPEEKNSSNEDSIKTDSAQKDSSSSQKKNEGSKPTSQDTGSSSKTSEKTSTTKKEA